MGAACWCGGTKGSVQTWWGQGPPAALRVAWRGSQAQAPLPAQPTPSGGPLGRWEQGDPLVSPWCIQWALSSPINRLPGVRGIELPDLCPAGPAPSASLLGFVGPRPGRLLAPDRPSGCRGDRFRLGHSLRSCPSLPHTLIRAGFLAAPAALLLHQPGPSQGMPPCPAGPVRPCHSEAQRQGCRDGAAWGAG